MDLCVRFACGDSWILYQRDPAMSSAIFTFFKNFSKRTKGPGGLPSEAQYFGPTGLQLSCYVPNDVCYVFHFCEAFDVGAGEEESMLYVTEYGVC